MTDNRQDVVIRNNFQNKGLDTQKEDLSTINVGLLDVDTAIIKYLNDVIQPTVEQDGVVVRVPVLYANPERWKNIRKDGVLRDSSDKLQVPLIILRRTNMSKNYLNNPVNKYLERDFHSTRWNSRNKYDRFAVQNGIVPSKRYVSVVYPDYYDMEYECIVWTDYQEQMNTLIEQISFEVENYWGENNQFKFKTSVDDYSNTVDLPDNSDRIVRSEFTMNVKAYLLPQSQIDKHGKPTQTNKTRFTTKKIIIEERLHNGFSGRNYERQVTPNIVGSGATLGASMAVVSGSGQSQLPNYDLTSTIVVELTYNGVPVAPGTVVSVTGSAGDGTIYVT